jgi:hypothetical protein
MHTRDCREFDFGFWHQRMVGKSGIRARRRLDAFADPMIHADEKGAQGPGIFVPVWLLLTFTLGRQVAPWDVLRTGNQIDPNVVGELHVFLAVRGRVNERSGSTAAPIFTRRVGVENLWTLIGRKMCLYAVSLSRDWVVLIEIKIRKERSHVEGEPVRPSEA